MPNPVSRYSTPEQKISLFRSYFRGREDVYPRRFESRKTGKSGYAPACANEWIRNLCNKTTSKCSTCPNRQFLHITDEVIRQHLSGTDQTGRNFIIGIYPMLLDETCFLLAVDFDKVSWQDDSLAYLETCRKFNLHVALERSRSGCGAHIWLFFEQAIPANLARELGSFILTETMEQHPDIGLDSYDRFFPNQDTLPQGGFGNLIALPFQNQARKSGNTVFVDDQFIPWPDQWAFLEGLRKISRHELDAVVKHAEHRGCIIGVPFAHCEEADPEPWKTKRPHQTPIAGPLPKQLELILADQIYIDKQALLPTLRNRLLRLAAFQNPEFYKAQAMRLPTYDKPRVIACGTDHAHYIGLPRGCLQDIKSLLTDHKIKYVINDQRNPGIPLHATFLGELRPQQYEAAIAMLEHETGVLAATTAFGKTVIAEWLIAKRGVNTLVLVHRRQLMQQWIQRLKTFLDLPYENIGRVGGGKKKPTGLLDVALIQSLVRNGHVDDIVEQYGHLIVDECHHLPAYSFEQVARSAKAKYITGLSATVTRKDGHHPIIFMQCGPIRYRVHAKQQADARPFHHTVIVRPTGFESLIYPDTNTRNVFHNLYNELITNEYRNQLICSDVVQAVQNGRSPLVLTERTKHLARLADILSPDIQNLIILQGGLNKRKLDAITSQLESITKNQPRVILATGRYIGEGFDDARLDTLFLALPVSWRGTITQYAGRLHRLYDRKREVQIYDYADLDVPPLSRMFDKRCQGYEAIGYEILLPAGAVPGWPAQVPLPADLHWKRNYAASVQRLIRDGVDVPLAKLFVQAAPSTLNDEHGPHHARSHAEAFLFHRLQTLPQTAGRFKLNTILPIPFDARGQMEVDLLQPDLKLVIEIDGPQHLADQDAYRRDRRKDAHLQEHGYFILRLLAQDISTKLDHCLDQIIRTVEHLRRCKNSEK